VRTASGSSALAPDAVALVLVGDELLLGHVVDTNAAWLGRRLAEAGLRVVGSAHVLDDAAAVAGAVRHALAQAPSVVVSGGLGPTSDDVTREGLAQLVGAPLRRDPVAVAHLTAWFARRGRALPTAALRMADVPAPAELIHNGDGSAPGVRLEVGGGVVYAVPGVPRELAAMVDAAVLPDLLRRAGPLAARRTATVRAAIVGESWVAGRLAGLEAQLADDPGAAVAYLASPGEVLVRLTVTRETAGAAEAGLAGYTQLAWEALGDVVAGDEGATVPATLVRLLVQRSATVAVAESLTAGAVAATLADAPGASEVLRGAVVAYAADVKRDVLGVPADVIARHGVVSAECARAMAGGVRRVLGSDWGVATTGVAGPTEHDGQPVGTVVVAVTGPDEARVRELRLPGDRASIRQLTVAHALDVLRRAVLGLPEPPGAARRESSQAAGR
jgi:nicotinamide-nucleotide amidase